ncbi:DMT family transporter [Pelomonas sp. SE-A7]|uniref:DMT family transporter n=1 Tax=Pelomonas sp. SE-A7 TaxID=3054953 RepID=UPI00259CCAE9|nr:DMT family transporter [Pelomonas sp. SE-A7]MDM4765070.1 DMT family transporter [Pelomonas sp. SE-A7]
MKSSDLAELLLLAAVWGASFLFLRWGAPAFGPLTLAGLRVLGAALFLLPILMHRQGLAELRSVWRPMLGLGLLTSAIPFVLFSYAALAITAGLSSILNATTPLWGALVAFVWLSQRLDAMRVLGLVVGFGGVVFLAWDQASFKPGGSGWAILACLGATLSYGLSASFTKRYLANVSAMTQAAGSQIAATVWLLPFALWFWPATTPEPRAWVSVVGLALLCSGLAYILYFRLLQRVGPTNALAVTFLIPVFALLWGGLFLGESLTLHMLAGCAIVLLGTALAVGLIKAPARQKLA